MDDEHGALHVLVNDIWGQHGEPEWDTPVWESDLEAGLRLLRLGVDTHAITSHFALPLLIRQPGGLVVEMTDGTNEYNAANYRVSFFYDVAKGAVSRMAFALTHELEPHDATALLLTPGWLRSEAMLEAFGVTEATWQEAAERIPHFAISESPRYAGRGVT
ncbi:short-chain dehydrogenase, partial [cyanobacterium TDX16]